MVPKKDDPVIPDETSPAGPGPIEPEAPPAGLPIVIPPDPFEINDSISITETFKEGLPKVTEYSGNIWGWPDVATMAYLRNLPKKRIAELEDHFQAELSKLERRVVLLENARKFRVSQGLE